MTDYAVRHLTRYRYSEPVSQCHNLAHLRPRECPGQRCDASELVVTPRPAVLVERLDTFGNPTTHFDIHEPHAELTVEARHRVRVGVEPANVPAESPPWEAVRDRLRVDRSPDWLAAYPFAFDSRYAAARPSLAGYAAASFPPGRPVLEGARDLTRRVHADFIYDPVATTVSTPVDEVFALRRGVCQDFAHLQIACLRSLGLSARYVSGYLATVPPPGRERLVGADAMHAWVAVFCGEAGWVEFDPTNDQIPDAQHIRLAWGRDYDDVSPLKGVILGGGWHTVSVSVDVEPVG